MIYLDLPAGRQAAGSRTSTAAARTSKRSNFCGAPTRRCSGAVRAPPRWRRNPPPGRWCRGRWTGAGSASATSGTWAGCTTPSTTSRKEPIHRRHHHGSILFGLHYAFSENFVLPLSHDEVVHGKRSILGRMPGDEWQRFANLRSYYGFMFGHPGKKLMFMGCEFAQDTEWNHDQSLPWHLLEQQPHRRRAAADSRSQPALSPDAGAAPARLRRQRLRMAGHRRRQPQRVRLAAQGPTTRARCVVAVNFTPEVRHNYRIRVPFAGNWREVLNTDAAAYGGSNAGNAGLVSAVVTATVRSSTLSYHRLLPSISYPKASQRIFAGSPHPLGATWDEAAAPIRALFSSTAEKVELCLFDRSGRTGAGSPGPARAHRGRLARLRWLALLPASFTATACTALIQSGASASIQAQAPDRPLHPAVRRHLPLDRRASSLSRRPPARGPRDRPARQRAVDDQVRGGRSRPTPGRTDRHPSRSWEDTFIYEAHIKGVTQLREDVPRRRCAAPIEGSPRRR